MMQKSVLYKIVALLPRFKKTEKDIVLVTNG